MSKLYVYLFKSRNKDNKNVPNFKERAKTVLAYEKDEAVVFERFEQFVATGLPGEKIRLYKSVNARDEEKVKTEIIVRLLRDKISLTKLDGLVASAAQQVHNRAESKWLYDCDVNDENFVKEFVNDIPVNTEVHKTPNGYAIVCEHGFDTRPIKEKYGEYDITLKKDELLFLKMVEKK